MTPTLPAASVSEVNAMRDAYTAEIDKAEAAHPGSAERELHLQNAMPAAATALLSRRESAAPSDDVLAALTRLFTSGYGLGHHHTVEGGYADVHYNDATTYHRALVEELLADSDYSPLSRREPVAKVTRDQLREVSLRAWNGAVADDEGEWIPPHRRIADAIYNHVAALLGIEETK